MQEHGSTVETVDQTETQLNPQDKKIHAQELAQTAILSILEDENNKSGFADIVKQAHEAVNIDEGIVAYAVSSLARAGRVAIDRRGHVTNSN